MYDFLRSVDPASRRTFLEIAARSLLGVTVLPATAALAAPAKGKGKPAKATKSSSASGGARPGTAKNVIYLFMTGAMSHLDTFDLKPGREVQGETKGINTNVSGMRFGELLPNLAKQADKLAVVRSLYTETGDHNQGRYLMRTSYKQIASIRHPGMGAWAMKLAGRRNKTLPDNVAIGAEPLHPGAGFLDPSYSPLPIGDPAAGLQNTKSPSYLTDAAFEERMKLVGKFDGGFQKKYPQRQVEAYNEFYRQARELMSSEDLKAFDISLEPEKVRTQYGDDRFGQGCLLARRLVENHVRFVEVALGNWDHHVDLYERIPEEAASLDRALSALLADLQAKDMLKDTLVVLATEFGRSPKINANAGRDHHPGVFSGLLAGGGIAGGRFYGTSDEDGHSPDEDPVAVADFNATIAHALGLPLEKEIISSSGRPFKVAQDGQPLLKLFA
jgi:hypothetical protein